MPADPPPDDRRDLRLFVGIDIPEEAAEAVAEVQAKFHGLPGVKARFTRRQNLHLTLKFLGEQPRETVAGIEERLATIDLPATETWLGDLGVFSKHGPLRILWIHLAGDGMPVLQQAVDRVLAPDFEPERQFMSHLTIARLKRVGDRRQFLQHVEQTPVPEVHFPVTEFTLKQSTLTPEGPVYQDLRRFRLGQETAP